MVKPRSWLWRTLNAMLGVCSPLGNKKPLGICSKGCHEQSWGLKSACGSSVKGGERQGDQLEDFCGNSAKGMKT